jgi:5'(3')-deoxyribonucleotidase
MKQRIGIDVDGVLRDFCHGLVRAIKVHHPEYLKNGYDETAVPTMEPESGMVTDWYLENNFNCTKKDLQQIYWYDQAKWIMGNGRPFEENVRTLKYWMKHINKEWVCITSQKEHARHYTLSWLGKHELNFDKVVFVKGSDKWQVDVDYLIDDSPANYNYWKDGRQDEDGFILLDRPYNQKIKPTHRVFDLRGAERIIL